MSAFGAIRKHSFATYVDALTALLALFSWYLSRGYYEDDAFISLRYARNLLDGSGMTWNPGERVEGYTNFLFILLEAALGRLDMDLALASRVISFAAFFGLLAVLRRYLCRQPDALHKNAHAALAMAVVGSSVPLLAWCWGGLESVLFALFSTAAVCLALEWLEGGASAKKAAWLGIMLALATLTRPEGLIFFAVTAGFFLPRRANFSPLGWMLCPFALIFLPYMAWRVAYFGHWLPNTYYAKAWGIAPSILWPRGLSYLAECLLLPPWLVPFCAGLLAFAARAKALTAPMVYLTLLSAVFFFYIASVGGDFMPYVRFIIPVIPLLALLMYHGAGLLSARSNKRWRDVAFALIVCLLMQPAVAESGVQLSTGAVSGLAVAGYVKSRWPKGALVALNPAGALPYSAPDYRYIDMLGLLDPHIARRAIATLRTPGQAFPGHMKGDGAYVLSRKPDYIIFGMCWGAEKPEFLSDAEIAESPRFRAHYEKITAWITPPASLLPQLEAMTGDHVPGLAMNDKNQLRFIFYRRRK
ncbi:MAG: hypothetical protein KGI29_04260 [Pseudomonadota bacterium]|nr:hypothetical protein [Pseudomonadota bacterium]MDE3036997.1 hypothetical protein [Pseudomonadota bacterium]